MKTARTLTAYPLCNGRGVLLTLADGTHGAAHSQFRVSFNKLISCLTDAERARWNRLSIMLRYDEFGIHPEQIEQFLSTLPRLAAIYDDADQPTENVMATATSPSKKAAKRPAKKKVAKKPAARDAVKKLDGKLKEAGLAATVTAGGKTAKLGAGNGKAPVAKLTKDTGNAKFDADQKVLPGVEDVKIPAIETCIKRVVAAEAAQAAAKEEHDLEVSRLPGLFRKHGVPKYAAHGRSVSISPGVDKVVIKKVKDK